MKIKDLSKVDSKEFDTLLRRIPFYYELENTDPDQFKQLLSFSCIVDLEPGETIMRRGDRGTWLYFLIKGRLNVFIEPALKGPAINNITPGELFGDLALLCEHQRKATVIADPQMKEIRLFATDFKSFGDLEDFSIIKMNTKLIFYRTMVHSIRWRLEVNRMENPEHPLVNQLRRIPLFVGEKNTLEELNGLYKQAQYMADLLDRWNQHGPQIQDILCAPSQA